ncbi:tripartite tricarboxylate transporter substrate binding protein [Cupriavidus alkaliphilus]|uniref:tripartite tricarboxylate transporter substrate binding protein n=1 Tax=Cupriavidus alkaliphilus TaxID=942866 RepID=UPI000DC54475|nr:tripartite tricarboxylate transporter substrate binding protein [Cupriavidus alkaliphilus]RAS03491.1 tripartite-type tricarboxylate transporter receptor subunit TctC [Cupriavidus alkaliphilus]
MLKRWTCLLALTLITQVASAQSPYPSRPITFILPFSAGGATDIVSRALAEDMSKRLGQPIIVENRPGASGMIGTNAGAKAPADGYTVLLTPTQAILNNQFLYARLPYDTRKDLAFVTEVCSASVLLVVNPRVPVNSVRALLDWSARNRTNLGSWGIGSFGHLASAHLARTRKADFTHVAYKGEAPMIQDLVGGQLDMAFISAFGAKPFIDSGKLRVLAVTSEHRLPVLPNVPTLAEAGLPDPEMQPTGKLVMMVPAATPAPIVDRLEQAARAAIGTDAMRSRMRGIGLEPIGNSGKQALASYEAMYPVQQRLVQLTGARLD